MIVQSGFYDTLRWSLPIVSAQGEYDANGEHQEVIRNEPAESRGSLIGDNSDLFKSMPKQEAKKPPAQDRGSSSNYRTNSIEALFGKMFIS